MDIKFGKFLFFVITALFLHQISFCQTVTVDVVAAQNGLFKHTVTTNGSVDNKLFSIKLINSSKTDQTLNTIDISLTLEKPLPDGTPFMVGADEMLRREGNMLQMQTGKPMRSKNNNMYLLFKRGPADYILAGVISWRTFLCSIYPEDGLIHINGDGDHKLIKAGEKHSFEKIVLLHDNSWQKLLDRYASMIAVENKVPVPSKKHWKGWATWDFYKQYFTAEAVERNTQYLSDLNVSPNIIQIDGGWWKQRGDYFDVRENLSGGIKAMVEKIHKAGYKAGLHFDGFRASAESNIAKEHPEYFIHADDGKLLELDRDKVTNDPQVLWDYSHPGARAYITAVMKNARENWKVDYFKIDFMRQGLTRGVSFLPVTNVERYRMGINAMRKGIKDAYFLACSANFGVNIGLIEATRTGPDIDPDYEAVKMRVAHNSASYYFAEKLYHCDPDYEVVRSAKESSSDDRKKPSLTVEQAQMWTNFVTIFGNVRIASDELSLLSVDKKKLLQQSFKMPFFTKSMPVDLWDHYKTDNDAPNIFLAKTADGVICLGIFNWENKDDTFSISGFDNGSSFKNFYDSTTRKTENNSLTISLKGVQSVLLKYEGKQTFDALQEKLVVAIKK
ncbi:MAG: alpha-galactosidase [Chitinophagaceae bacterium]